jgi:hypothetical protein
MSDWKFGTIIRGQNVTLMILGKAERDIIADDGNAVFEGDYIGLAIDHGGEPGMEEDWPLGKLSWVSTDPENYEEEARTDPLWNLVSE